MSSPTSASRRPISRWRLRRIEADLPRHLSLEKVLVGKAASLDTGRLELATPRRYVPAVLTGTAVTGPAPTPYLIWPASVWTGAPILGSARSVALDGVDARDAAGSARSARKQRAAQSTHWRRRSAVQKKQLSLAERLLLVLQPPLESLLDPQGILEWPGPLYPYQQEGVAALVERDALLLADDMGLGKTVQAIAALRVLIHWRRASRALVVAPVSLLSQWRRELRHWAPELQFTVVRGSQIERRWLWRSRSHVFVVSYETLRQDASFGSREGPLEAEWDVVILDEAQRIKNPATKTARACKRLPRRTSWALTGTPLENDLYELGSIVDFLRSRLGTAVTSPAP